MPAISARRSSGKLRHQLCRVRTGTRRFSESTGHESATAGGILPPHRRKNPPDQRTDCRFVCGCRRNRRYVGAKRFYRVHGPARRAGPLCRAADAPELFKAFTARRHSTERLPYPEGLRPRPGGKRLGGHGRPFGRNGRRGDDGTRSGRHGRTTGPPEFRSPGAFHGPHPAGRMGRAAGPVASPAEHRL